MTAKNNDLEIAQQQLQSVTIQRDAALKLLNARSQELFDATVAKGLLEAELQKHQSAGD